MDWIVGFGSEHKTSRYWRGTTATLTGRSDSRLGLVMVKGLSTGRDIIGAPGESES